MRIRRAPCDARNSTSAHSCGSAAVLGMAITAFGLVGPAPRASAAALAVSKPTVVTGRFLDLKVDAGGGVRVATAALGTDDAPEHNWVTRLTPGLRSSGRSTILRPTTPLRYDLTSVLTPTGAITAYRARGGGKTVIDTVDARSGHRPERPLVSSTLGQLASEPELYAGGGTVALMYTARSPGGGKPQETVAVRPRGRTAFLTPRAVDPPDHQETYRYSAALGPHGDGAIVATPVFADTPIRLRRILASGEVGPWITIAEGPYEDSFADVAVAKDGLIAVAMIATPSGQPSTDSDPEAYLVTTTLPVDSPTATPLQTLEPVGDGITAEDNYGVDIGAGDRVVVTTSVDGPQGDEGPAQVEVFGGPPGALVKQASFNTRSPSGATAVARADGGITAVWQTRKGNETTLLMGAEASRDSTFSTPRLVARTVFKASRKDVQGEVEPRALRALRGSRAVLAYSDETNDRLRLSVVALGTKVSG